MIRPGLALAHVRRRRTHRAVMPLEMDADDLVPFLLAHVEDHPIAQDAGDVDQDVELPEFLDRVIDERLAAGHRRDILAVGSRAPTCGFDLVHHFVRPASRLPFLPSTVTPRSLTTTAAPSAASNFATPRPIPRPLPVTAATLPSSLPMMIPLSRAARMNCLVSLAQSIADRQNRRRINHSSEHKGADNEHSQREAELATLLVFGCLRASMFLAEDAIDEAICAILQR